MALTGIWKKRAAAEVATARAARLAREAEEAKVEDDRKTAALKQAIIDKRTAHHEAMYKTLCEFTVDEERKRDAALIHDELWDWLQTCATCNTDHTSPALCLARHCITHVYVRALKPGYETHGATYTCRSCGHLERDDAKSYRHFLRDFIDRKGVPLCVEDTTMRYFTHSGYDAYGRAVGVDLAEIVHDDELSFTVVSPETYDRLAEECGSTKRSYLRKRKPKDYDTPAAQCAGCHHDKLTHQKKGCTTHGCSCSKFRRPKH